MGLYRAGFDEIRGYDIAPQPRYPFEFYQRDVLTLTIEDLQWADFIWASPPCQANTALKTMHNAKKHECIIEWVRLMLAASNKPWVIENVVGAPLIDPVQLCGTALGLEDQEFEMQRERLFEANWPVRGLPCNHRKPVLGVYGGHIRDRRRRPGSKSRGRADPPSGQAQAIMGIDWMTLAEMSQAIPPAYSEYIARQWLAAENLV